MENPFIIAGKIKPAYFCDREEESMRLVRQVTNQGNVVLMSPRRLGKTGLIDFCFDSPSIRQHYVTIFIDILRTSSLNEFTYILGRAVFEAIGQRSQQMMKRVVATLKSLSGSFGYDPVNNMPTFDIKLGDIANPEYTLEEIFKCIEQTEKRCIIAIDEFQQIANYPEKNIEALLRTHIQHSANANFIFSGSERHLMNEMFLDTARPFYNSADIMLLAPIAVEKYLAFVKQHFELSGRQVEGEAVRSVYQQVEGNTYYMQKIFHDIYAELDAGSTCSIRHTSDALQRLISENHQKYSEMLSRLSLPQKELLYAVAAEGRATQITSGAFIRKHHLKSASSVQAATKKLMEYHFLSTEAGAYYIDDQLLRLWLMS
ncbi:MAG: ATP-binding protein [Prevotella sp.]|nr:ATP-binding protein [Prevotella sp.]